jgi:hypothetical protein
MEKHRTEPLSLKGFALAFGITWASGVLGLGLLSMVGWGMKFVDVVGSVYLGYSSTALGVLIGTLWALIDGAIAGAIFACLYNLLTKSK